MEDSHKELGLTPPKTELQVLLDHLKRTGLMAAVMFMDPHPTTKRFINFKMTYSMPIADALGVYANTPNPASVLLYGDTMIELKQQYNLMKVIAKRVDYFDYINQFI